jgi:soluble lytic murein transglycosylase-like protein
MRANLWPSLLLLGVIPAANADIYAFTDARGITYFSNVPVDPRYQPLLTDPAAPARPTVPAPGWRDRERTFASLIDEVGHAVGVDPALLRAVIAVESAFDPTAVSRKGAQGLMQLQPPTARRYGVQRPFDPRENLRGGAAYLHDLLKRYNNDLKLVLAAYNAGEDAVDRHGRTVPPFPETQAYVPAVLRFYRRFLAALPKA